LQVIGEVCDGLEVVQEAVELKPDLIIMDIGLPSLNGIEAARAWARGATLLKQEEQMCSRCGRGYLGKAVSVAHRQLIPI
jgi:DNA-binding NarL/FixJ family response regulator